MCVCVCDESGSLLRIDSQTHDNSLVEFPLAQHNFIINKLGMALPGYAKKGELCVWGGGHWQAAREFYVRATKCSHLPLSVRHCLIERLQLPPDFCVARTYSSP